LRAQMACEARKWGEQLGSLESSMKSWKTVFHELL